MQLHDLVPNPGSNHHSKKVGRGHGSGKGKTAGRGTKGQKARAGGNVKPGFAGGQTPIYKQLPYKRGFTNIFKIRYEILNVSDLENVEGDATPANLHASGLISTTKRPLKILGHGELNRALKVSAHKFSDSARSKIEAAGGSVEEIKEEIK